MLSLLVAAALGVVQAALSVHIHAPFDGQRLPCVAPALGTCKPAEVSLALTLTTAEDGRRLLPESWVCLDLDGTITCLGAAAVVNATVYTPRLAVHSAHVMSACVSTSPGLERCPEGSPLVTFTVGGLLPAADIPGAKVGISWPTGGGLVSDGTLIELDLVSPDDGAALRMQSRQLCLSLDDRAPQCFAVMDLLTERFRVTGLPPGPHTIVWCLAGEGAPFCQEDPAPRRAPALAGPEGPPLLVSRSVFSVVPALVPPDGVLDGGVFTPDTIHNWPQWVARNDFIAAPGGALTHTLTIVDPAPNTIAKAHPTFGVVSTVDTPGGLLCVLYDVELRPAAVLGIAAAAWYSCAQAPPGRGLGFVPSPEAGSEGYHTVTACVATQDGTCLPGLVSAPAPYVFFDGSDTVEGIARPGRPPARTQAWVAGSLLLRINRQADPPLRAVLPSVLSAGEARQVRREYEAHKATLSPDFRDELVLPANHFAVGRARAALLDALHKAGLSVRNLLLEYAVLSGSENGDGIVIHADNCRPVQDGLTRVALGHTPLRAWGMSMMLSEAGSFSGGGQFEFVAQPSAMLSFSQGDAVVFSAGMENAHRVHGGIQGARVVALFWFQCVVLGSGLKVQVLTPPTSEEPWGDAPEMVATYRGLLDYFHTQLQVDRLGNDTLVTASMRAHHTRLLGGIADLGLVAVPAFFVATGQARAEVRRQRLPPPASVLQAGLNPVLVPSQVPATVVITGARAGIGQQLTRQLAALGHVRVLATVRALTAEVEATRDALRAQGATVEYFVLDVTSGASVDAFGAAVEAVVGTGGVDVLVHNAAIIVNGWTEDAFSRSIDTNCVAPAALTADFQRRGLFRADGRSHVVHVSSQLGELAVVPQPYQDTIRNASYDTLRSLAFIPADTGLDLSSSALTYFVAKACMNRAAHLLHMGHTMTGAAFRGRSSAVHPGHVRTQMGGFAAPAPAREGAAAILRVVLGSESEVGSGRFWQPDGTLFPAW